VRVLKSWWNSILDFWPLWVVVAGLFIAPKIFGGQGKAVKNPAAAAKASVSKKAKKS
jgi:Na+-translocating ferredoxin:NAD+ oxidoreductase RnfD subunit